MAERIAADRLTINMATAERISLDIPRQVLNAAATIIYADTP